MIGPDVAKIILVQWEEEIVIITPSVMEIFSVALIIVQRDHQAWIVVRWRFSKVQITDSFLWVVF